MTQLLPERATIAARPAAPEWGSDVVAEVLRRLGIEYAALNPGASFRGLHDSLVNYLGNERPRIVLCNHEEVAVSIAHGYAKFAERAMAAIVHSNVGLMHASMAVFDAWADRVPVLVLGGNGPMDAARRRPWIDWIHTTHGQGLLVRDYTKWEHQPASVEAIPEALLRAWHAAHVEPAGPVYVAFDVSLQEQALEPGRIALPDVSRYPLPEAIAPAPELVRQAASWLVEAEYPVILLGRTGRGERVWNDLVALAEALGAAVLSDLKSAVSFPTNHPLHQAGLSTHPDEAANEVLRRADVVLALERIDVAGTLRGAKALGGAKLANVSLGHYALRSAVQDQQELPPADLPIPANVDRTVAALLDAVRGALHDNPAARRRTEDRARMHADRRTRLEAEWHRANRETWEAHPISLARLVGELRGALGERARLAIRARGTLAWPNGVWDFVLPGASLGGDGGGGIGSGPGMSVGVALAASGSGRFVFSILGDGDMLMAPSALWTAAHMRIPLLFVLANNQTYMNDEEHQERVAIARGRPLENKWIGQRMDDPPVDFAALASSMGVEGIGPVIEPDELAGAFRRAVAAVGEGRPALVDVRIGRGS